MDIKLLVKKNVFGAGFPNRTDPVKIRFIFVGYPVLISHYGNHKKKDRTANHHYFRIGLYFSSLLVVFSQMINHHPTLILYD
jgi:hypothetical protein